MKRLPMRKIRDVLRLSAEDLSTRQIVASLAIGRTTLRCYLDRATELGLSWPLPPEMSDTDLERLIYGASRADLFATLDRPNLQTLPPGPYVFAKWKRARVAPDYHVEVDSSWYSVPFALIKQEVDVRTSGQTVEIFHRGRRVASHLRTAGRRNHVTVADHMPSAHRRLGEWTPVRVLAQATKTGPAVAAFCALVMADRPHLSPDR